MKEAVVLILLIMFIASAIAGAVAGSKESKELNNENGK